MANDSATAGYLTTDGAPDAYDQELDRVLQQAVVGLTGLPGQYVRPRWQPEPPAQPPYDVDWCAIGVSSNPADTFAYEVHDPTANAGAGSDVVERDEELEVLCSFYGPRCNALAASLRDALSVDQNRAALRGAGIALVEVGRAVQVPALFTDKWLRRVDVPVTLRRRTHRTFKVLTIESGQLGIDNELFVTPIDVNHP